MRVINNTPIWVLGNDEINLVRVTANANYVGGRDFFDCSKWIERDNAEVFAKKFPELTLFRVMESENGNHRTIVQFITENA